MRDLFNLGDLGDPTAPEAHPALIDCRDWDHPLILSHSELDRQVDACARGLVSTGLARGDRVAILSLNRVEMLVAYFAIMRAGFVGDPHQHQVPARDHCIRPRRRRSAICILRHSGPRTAASTDCPWSISTPQVRTALRASSIPARSKPSARSLAKRRWCYTHQARPAGRRACHYRTTVSSGRCDPVSAPAVMSDSGCWWRRRCST